MPENNAMRTPLSKEISPMEITFDKMYACIDMGETANALLSIHSNEPTLDNIFSEITGRKLL